MSKATIQKELQIATCELKSASEYSQTRYHSAPFEDGESHDAYEIRTVREKLWSGPSGEVFIPRMAFKNALTGAAKFLKEKIPGKGSSTWTARIKSGLMIMDDLKLGIQKPDVPTMKFFVSAQPGRQNSGRVWRHFPVINDWSGRLVVALLDPSITAEVLQRHLACAGKFIGIGYFRPENNGFWGRFDVLSCTIGEFEG